MATQKQDTHLHIRLDTDTKDKAIKIANQRGLTLSQLIRSMIRRVKCK